MADIKISVMNSSTVLSDDQVKAAVGPLQKQITNDFGPVWGVAADLDFVPKGAKPASGHWWLVVLDNSDQAGALGYHDITPEGLPLAKVFAATDLEYGSAWTVTASHELLEMLGDPAINLTALVQTDFTVDQNVVGRLYAYEVCDACEADSYGYKVDGVLVSDFVYPAWFEPFRKPGSTQFDQQKKINSPFELLPGGYISVYDMTSGTGWQQISAPLPAGVASRVERAPVGSRRDRRKTPRSQWVAASAQPGAAGGCSLEKSSIPGVNFTGPSGTSATVSLRGTNGTAMITGATYAGTAIPTSPATLTIKPSDNLLILMIDNTVPGDVTVLECSDGTELDRFYYNGNIPQCAYDIRGV